jgi:DnaD/phage-associated family protein
LFIAEYLPSCGEKALKTYLYGLYAIGSGNENINTLSKYENALNMTESEIIAAYETLEEMGVVEILSKNPLQVQYIPLSGVYGKPRKIKAGKYGEFTKQVQTLLPDRMISLNEFNEYFNLIETYNIEPEALIMAIKYCTLIKNADINYRYILAVAKNWIARGITTLPAAEKELMNFGKQSQEIKEVLKALGQRGGADYADITLLAKWREQFGFTLDSILYCANTLKGGKGGMKKLDGMLTEFFKYKKFSVKEIEDYITEKQKYRDTAYAVLKELGEYLPNIDPAIQNYIVPWMDKGFDEQTLTQIANYCFKAQIKSLEGMDKLVNKLHKLGLITLQSINEYISEQYQTEKFLQKVLETAGLSRQVNHYDRSNYNLWGNIWGISDELILFAAGQCRDYYNPLKNLHSLLSYYKNNNILTVDKAKKVNAGAVLGKAQKDDKNGFVKREYTAEELNAMFTSIEDYEI